MTTTSLGLFLSIRAIVEGNETLSQRAASTNLIQRSHVSMTLKDAHFGISKAYDTLILEPLDPRWTGFEISPAMILAFIEGVLGYTMISSTESFWSYRRNRPFSARMTTMPDSQDTWSPSKGLAATEGSIRY